VILLTRTESAQLALEMHRWVEKEKWANQVKNVNGSSFPVHKTEDFEVPTPQSTGQHLPSSTQNRCTTSVANLRLGLPLQGWRKSMEDAHMAVLDLGDNADTAMFGVFDGHGGR